MEDSSPMGVSRGVSEAEVGGKTMGSRSNRGESFVDKRDDGDGKDYSGSPVEFVSEMLGGKPYPKQRGCAPGRVGVAEDVGGGVQRVG